MMSTLGQQCLVEVRETILIQCFNYTLGQLVHSMYMNRLSACTEFRDVHSRQNGTRCTYVGWVLWYQSHLV